MIVVCNQWFSKTLGQLRFFYSVYDFNFHDNTSMAYQKLLLILALSLLALLFFEILNDNLEYIINIKRTARIKITLTIYSPNLLFFISLRELTTYFGETNTVQSTETLRNKLNLSNEDLTMIQFKNCCFFEKFCNLEDMNTWNRHPIM